MKKITIALIICSFFHGTLAAQKLMHSIGATISVLSGTITSPSSSASYSLIQTNFTYFPRYNFIEKERSSCSIGLPIGIGIGIASNTFEDDAGIAFAYDLPAVIDYNLGAKSTNDNEDTFGGYLGLGFGYYKVNISKSAYSNYNGSTYGPLIRGGVRIASAQDSWGGLGITIGLFYKKGLEKSKLNSFGFNVLLDL